MYRNSFTEDIWHFRCRCLVTIYSFVSVEKREGKSREPSKSPSFWGILKLWAMEQTISACTGDVWSSYSESGIFLTSLNVPSKSSHCVTRNEPQIALLHLTTAPHQGSRDLVSRTRLWQSHENLQGPLVLYPLPQVYFCFSLFST